MYDVLLNQALRQSHLYTRIGEDGSKDTAIEEFISRIENEVAPIIEKIVEAARCHQIPGLTPLDKETWDWYFAHQIKRVPDMHAQHVTREAFEEEINKAIANYEREVRPLTDQERTKFSSREWMGRAQHNATAEISIVHSPELKAAFEQKGLGILKLSNPKKCFVMGSSPIVKFNHPDRPHLLDPRVEMWFPIASDVAVSPAPEVGTEKLVQEADDAGLRYINIAIFRQSTVVAGRSKALLESLSNPR